MAPPDDVDRTAELVARNQELLIRARETRDWTRAALKQAEYGVRQAMRTRIAQELSRQPPVPHNGERVDLPKHPECGRLDRRQGRASAVSISFREAQPDARTSE